MVCYKEKVILALAFAEYCKVNDNIKGKLQWQISQIIDVKIDELLRLESAWHNKTTSYSSPPAQCLLLVTVLLHYWTQELEAEPGYCGLGGDFIQTCYFRKILSATFF